MASLKKRGNNYYAQYYANGAQKRVNLHTDSLQIAKEKLRRIESALFRGDDIPLPTRTPLPQLLSAYANYLYATKDPKNADKDLSCLRLIFGPITPELAVRNERVRAKASRHLAGHDELLIRLTHIEQLTTRDVAEFIVARVRREGVKAKTANGYRQILTRLVNWAMTQYGVRMPGDRNPAAKAERYRESPPEIVFLDREQIAQQLAALAGEPVLEAIVAVYIYAGLRRSEALWLTRDDIDLGTGRYGVLRIRAKTVNGRSWTPKTGRNRVVPLSATLRVYLDRYVPAPSDGRWLFPSPQGKWWDPDNFSRDLAAANARAGLSWGPDEYRHTFGSHLAMRGESLYKISQLMGNSPEVCRRHYAALTTESLLDCVELFDEAVGAPGGGPPTAPPAAVEERGSAGRAEDGGPRLRLVVNNGGR